MRFGIAATGFSAVLALACGDDSTRADAGRDAGLDTGLDARADARADADADAAIEGASLALLAPRRALLGERVPFRVVLRRDAARDWAHEPTPVDIEAGDARVRVELVRGMAVGWITPSAGAEAIRASLGALDATRPVAIVEDAERVVRGTLAGDELRWSGRVRVEGDVVVPAGQTLVIEPGTHVRLDAGVGLQVLGDLQAEGGDDPITLLASDPSMPFGHIRASGSVRLGAVFVSGGGAGAWTHAEFRHCCIPMLWVDDGSLTVTGSTFFDSPSAKGILTENTDVVIRDTIFSGLGFGTEHFTEPPHTVLIEDCAYREMRGIDDDDGMYFWRLGDAVVRRTTISGVDDDGVDIESATPRLEDVLIEDAADKCVSVTNEGPTVVNAFFQRCRVGVKVDGTEAASRFERVTMIDLLEEGVRLSDREGSQPDAIIRPVFDRVILGPVPTPLLTDYDPLDATFSDSVLPAELGTSGTGNLVAVPDLEGYEPREGSAAASLGAGFREW